jgi:hypothetical protein
MPSTKFRVVIEFILFGTSAASLWKTNKNMLKALQTPLRIKANNTIQKMRGGRRPPPHRYYFLFDFGS